MPSTSRSGVESVLLKVSWPRRGVEKRNVRKSATDIGGKTYGSI
jgi:hypothetical protein